MSEGFPTYSYIFFISNGYVPSKIYTKRDDFHFDIVIIPILDGDVHILPLMGFT